MKGIKNNLSLRIILIVVAVTTISNVWIGFVVNRNSSNSLKEMMYQDLQHSINAVAREMDLNNEKQIKMLETLASNPEIRDPDKSLLEKSHIVYRALQKNQGYIDLTILDLEGNAYIRDGEKIVSFAERDYFKEAKKGKIFITDPFVNKVTNELAMFYSLPVYDFDNNIINVVFCVVDGFKLSDLCMEHPIANNRIPYVISAQSYLTLANEDHEKVAKESIKEIEMANQGTSLGTHLTALLSGVTGHDIYTDNGKKWMSAYERIPNTNWIAACSVPFEDFHDKVLNLQKSLFPVFTINTIFVALVCGIAISFAIKPLKKLRGAIGEIAEGNADLTKRLDVKSKDEVGDVVSGFNQFTDKLHTIISQVKSSKDELSVAGKEMSSVAQDTASSITQIIANIESVNSQIINQSNSVTETAGAVNQIASNIESLEHMIANQSSGVTEASAAVEEMIGNIRSVNKSVTTMAESFSELEEKTQAGVSIQQDVNSRIEIIKGQSETLQNANTAIAAIAEQTNLLAMNAAIEAAHAGEAGKGFSVVADEIRKLSETSADQTKTIGEQLEKIRESIEEVVEASEKSGAAFQEVSAKIEETDVLVRQIKNAMEEQEIGSQQIGQALHVMNDSTSEVRTASAEMAEGNKQILQEINHLQNATENMKSSMEEMSSGAGKINETGSALSEISGIMTNSIDKIGKEIDLFKV